ncbi:MAG: S4 domain-containing protein YaaA [Erysipelotrichaceae bacterium]|nr:S4 domain-containing protein YaaA [Erysipelotrichaceae bacterium]MBO7697549.1 S4 domain-containing protein YaaA [Erysipelotrichaceae bacterium]MBP5279597.1 S4 domain-containing protein YaaA [Erysipelotrichaceae bacterium]
MIKNIKIDSEFITLGQFLKAADIISSGGEAKSFLAENRILVNGEEDKRRGRKLYKDDMIQIDGKRYVICI